MGLLHQCTEYLVLEVVSSVSTVECRGVYCVLKYAPGQAGRFRSGLAGSCGLVLGVCSGRWAGGPNVEPGPNASWAGWQGVSAQVRNIVEVCLAGKLDGLG